MVFRRLVGMLVEGLLMLVEEEEEEEEEEPKLEISTGVHQDYE